MAKRTAVVCGAGGFIGGHLVASLRSKGEYDVRAVDINVLDLRLRESCVEAAQGVDVVYNLAADMGGMGFIENNKALCMLSVLVNTHLLQAAVDAKVDRYFYA